MPYTLCGWAEHYTVGESGPCWKTDSVLRFTNLTIFSNVVKKRIISCLDFLLKHEDLIMKTQEYRFRHKDLKKYFQKLFFVQYSSPILALLSV